MGAAGREASRCRRHGSCHRRTAATTASASSSLSSPHARSSTSTFATSTCTWTPARASPLKRSVRSRRRERRGCRRERSSGERSSRSEGSSPRSSSKTPPSNELAWTARSSSRRFAPRRLGRARRFGSAIGDVGPPHSGTSLRSCSGGGLEVGSYVSHESSSSLANTSDTLAPTPTLRNSLLASSRSCSSSPRKSSSSSSKSASRGLNSECA